MTVEEVLSLKGIEDQRQVIGFGLNVLNINDDNHLEVTNGVWLCCV